MNSDLDELIKDKRKSKRRSSIVACEALKLMNINGSCNNQEFTEDELIDNYASAALEWIDSQLRRYKQKLSVSTKLVAKTNLNLASNLNANFDRAKAYETLTDEHKQFLNSVSVPEDLVINILRNKHKELIQVIYSRAE